MSQAAEAPSSDTADGTRDVRTMKWISGLAVLLGLWLVITPFAMESTATAMWNNVIVGAAIIILAGFNFYRMSNAQLGNIGVSALVALLGLWALIVPFVFEMGSNDLLWSTAIAGLIIAILGGYNLYATRKATTAAPARA